MTQSSYASAAGLGPLFPARSSLYRRLLSISPASAASHPATKAWYSVPNSLRPYPVIACSFASDSSILLMFSMHHSVSPMLSAGAEPAAGMSDSQSFSPASSLTQKYWSSPPFLAFTAFSSLVPMPHSHGICLWHSVWDHLTGFPSKFWTQNCLRSLRMSNTHNVYWRGR